MAITTPVGGSVVKQAATTNLTVPVAQWTGNWQGRPADVTMTDGGGFTSYRAFVIDPRWNFTIYQDDGDAAIAGGITQGQIITLAFKLGGIGTADVLVNTTVLGIDRVLNANGDPIGVTFNGAGGTLTLNTTVPAAT